MLLSEFKAWFDGFTEDMDGPPTEKQWARVKDQVKEITGQAISYPVYIDRYVRPHINQPYWLLAATQGASLQGQHAGANQLANYGLNAQNTYGFDSNAAMYAAGKAEAVTQ